MPPPDTRPLTAEEYRLTRWMLEHGGPQAQTFLPQLEAARATTWRCPCGCASFHFHVDTCQPGASPVSACTVNYLCDFYFEEAGHACGILLSQQNGVLQEAHLWGTDDAPSVLPNPDTLRPFEPDTASAHSQAADPP